QVVDVVVDPDLGVWTHNDVPDVRAAEDLRGVEPEAELRQLHLVEQVIDLRPEATVHVLGPAGLLPDGADEPDAAAADEAVQALEGLPLAREPAEADEHRGRHRVQVEEPADARVSGPGEREAPAGGGERGR